jgi:hypothetical protein
MKTPFFDDLPVPAKSMPYQYNRARFFQATNAPDELAGGNPARMVSGSPGTPATHPPLTGSRHELLADPQCRKNGAPRIVERMSHDRAL